MSGPRLTLDDAQALAAATIARAAQLRPTPGGRQWAVLVAVLRLTTGWRRPADWLTVASVARLAFGLDAGASVTRHQWEDTTAALREWTRHKVIRTKPPRGRPAVERRRWWVAVDLDAQRTPTPGELAPVAPPDPGGARDVQLPPGQGETPPDSGGALLPPTPGDTPRSKYSQDVSQEEEEEEAARERESAAIDTAAPPPSTDDLDTLEARFARHITRPPDRLDPGETANIVAELRTRWGPDAVETWLDGLDPGARWRYPREAADVADATIADTRSNGNGEPAGFDWTTGQATGSPPGHPTHRTCPDCHGRIWVELDDDDTGEVYPCLTCHARGWVDP